MDVFVCLYIYMHLLSYSGNQSPASACLRVAMLPPLSSRERGRVRCRNNLYHHEQGTNAV